MYAHLARDDALKIDRDGPFVLPPAERQRSAERGVGDPESLRVRVRVMGLGLELGVRVRVRVMGLGLGLE